MSRYGTPVRGMSRICLAIASASSSSVPIAGESDRRPDTFPERVHLLVEPSGDRLGERVGELDDAGPRAPVGQQAETA